jgi:hypothetical protein
VVVRQQARCLVGDFAMMLALGMVVLGLAAFAAMLAFVTLCDRV